MRRWLIGLAAGLACAAGLSAYAVTAGGFPSFPWFQAVGIGTAAPTGVGGIATSGPGVDLFGGNADNASNASSGIVIGSEGGTSSGLPIVDWVRSGGASNEKVWACKASLLVNDDFACFTATDAFGYGSAWLEVQRSGTSVTVANFPAGVLEDQGQPLTIKANVAGSSGGCTLSNNAIITSCSRSAVGTYVLTFSQTLQTVPVCVADYYGGPGYAAYVDSQSTTSVRVVISETVSPFTGTDGPVEVICK